MEGESPRREKKGDGANDERDREEREGKRTSFTVRTLVSLGIGSAWAIVEPIIGAEARGDGMTLRETFAGARRRGLLGRGGGSGDVGGRHGG